MRKEDVLLLKSLIEAGAYRAVLDRAYPLEDVVEAHRYVETQQKVGNVVLTIRVRAVVDDEQPGLIRACSSTGIRSCCSCFGPMHRSSRTRRRPSSRIGTSPSEPIFATAATSSPEAPLVDQDDERLRSISIWTCDAETARRLSNDDPAVQAGRLRGRGDDLDGSGGQRPLRERARTAVDDRGGGGLTPARQCSVRGHPSLS